MHGNGPSAPLIKLRGVIDHALGFDTTVHLYLSGGKEGSRALPLHADNYNVRERMHTTN